MLKRQMGKLTRICVIAFASVFASSCGTTRVVFFDTHEAMVRIGPDVRGKVYFQRDGEWILSKNKVSLPDGWYAVGLPPEEE